MSRSTQRSVLAKASTDGTSGSGPAEPNSSDQTPKPKSKYRGVTWNKATKKWKVEICVDYKRHHGGYFDDETEAARAYDAKAIELRGEYTNLNFPEDKERLLDELEEKGPQGDAKPPCKRIYRGVYKRGKKWQVQLGHNGQRHHVGFYPSAEEGGRDYDVHALLLKGAKAKLNFPEEREASQKAADALRRMTNSTISESSASDTAEDANENSPGLAKGSSDVENARAH